VGKGRKVDGALRRAMRAPTPQAQSFKVALARDLAGMARRSAPSTTFTPCFPIPGE